MKPASAPSIPSIASTTYAPSPLEQILQEHNLPASVLDQILETEPSTFDSAIAQNRIGDGIKKHERLSWYELRLRKEVCLTYEKTIAALATAASAAATAKTTVITGTVPPAAPRIKRCAIGPFNQGFCTRCGLPEAR